MEAMNPQSPRQLDIQNKKPDEGPAWQTLVVPVMTACFTLLAILLLRNLEASFWSFTEIAWNAFVDIMPSSLVYGLRAASAGYPRKNASSSNLSIQHAEKSEILRNTFGIRTGRAPVGKGKNEYRDAPRGLGNFDNSCYQNSVLQAFAALSPLQAFLRRANAQCSQSDPACPTVHALHDLLNKLNDTDTDCSYYWTPARLKSMSSWQQQDAQEYYSKIVDAVDKDVSDDQKRLAAMAAPNLSSILLNEIVPSPERPEALPHGAKHTTPSMTRSLPTMPVFQDRSLVNPLEGLLAQRVGCTQCGYCEGLSLIPFNSLTLPLGNGRSYSLEDCLDAFSDLEYIEGVECPSCSLLSAEKQVRDLLERLVSFRDTDSGSPVPETLERIENVRERLRNIEHALSVQDFSEKVLQERCNIPSRLRKSSTKSRQAALLRAPHCLVIHVNRSVFDLNTGAQLKNYASVNFPETFNAAPWIVGGGASDKAEDSWSMDPLKSMLPETQDFDCASGTSYALKAVITHHGRHENGHYICWRRSAVEAKTRSEALTEMLQAEDQWWRISDEDVTRVNSGNVLSQPEAFMLFYERTENITADSTIIADAEESRMQQASINLALPGQQSFTGSGTEGVHISETGRRPTINEGDLSQPASIQSSGTCDPPALEARPDIALTTAETDGSNEQLRHFSSKTSADSIGQRRAISPVQMKTAIPTGHNVSCESAHSTAQMIPPI